MARLITYVDETGEIVRIERIDSQKKRKAYILRENKKTTRTGESFTFAHMENVKEVFPMLTTSELGYFLVLQTYIDFQTNVLVRSQKDKFPMSRADIGKALYLTNRTQIKKHIDKFIEKGLLRVEIIEGKEVFSVNPKYHFKGATRNEKVVKTFSTQIRKIYQNSHNAKSKKQPADLGFLYLMIPYLHMKDNTLCSNPYEQDAKKVDALSITDICRITGLDKKNVRMKINRLKWDGMRVFAKVVTGNRTHLKVNPLVFWRQDGKPPQCLVDLFLINGK